MAIGEYAKNLEASRKGFKEGWIGFNDAERSYRKATELREQLLQHILKETGLAVCSETHSDWRKEGIKDPSDKQLGIYPRDQMRLFYHQGSYSIQGEYEDSSGITKSLVLLCPEHFPQSSKWTLIEEGESSLIESGVYERDGKYVLAVNGRDITRMATAKSGFHILEPDGKKPFLIDVAVFRRLGIPDLPEKPDLDSLKYST